MPARFVGFTVLALPQRLARHGAARVVAWSEQPLRPNSSVRAWVGEQELTGVRFDQFGLAIEGFLADDPAPTDTLSVQVYGGEKVDTGLTAEDEGGIA